MAFLCSSSTSRVNTYPAFTDAFTRAYSYSRLDSVTSFQRRRKSWRACLSLTTNDPVLDALLINTGFFPEPAIMELPCLPFTAAEVFIPTATKTLHLYEARFLALLDEALGKYHNLFAHIVIERVSDGAEEGVLSFATKYGCLAQIESVRRMEVGALVTIRGVGRVNLVKLTQLEPFLKGSLVPFHDAASLDTEDVDAAVKGLRMILADVQRLQIKLRERHRGTVIN
ncbi:hypothetical protein L7F22_056643 [Adiantum nelumboides]|nr:hypothetical protein [Adiantum nelumboides]